MRTLNLLALVSLKVVVTWKLEGRITTTSKVCSAGNRFEFGTQVFNRFLYE